MNPPSTFPETLDSLQRLASFLLPNAQSRQDSASSPAVQSEFDKALTLGAGTTVGLETAERGSSRYINFSFIDFP
jgi:hypothetical protein